MKALFKVTAARRHTLLALGCASYNNGIWRATDLEAFVEYDHTVPGLPDETVVSAKWLKVVHDACKGKFEYADGKLNGFELSNPDNVKFEEMPMPAKALNPDAQITVDRETLAGVALAMADADIRYYLTGMSLDFDKGRIAATDGHRLHVADSLIVQGDANKGKSCIVPRGTVLLALAVLGKGESVTLGCGGKHVAFTVGSTRVVSKIIDGKFPDIDKVIPTHCARAATLMIANKAGAEAMKRYIALSKAAKDNRFRAAVQNGGLNGAHNVPTDAIRFGGKPTGFKLPYLIDAMTFNGGLTTEFAWFNLDASIMSRSSNRVAVVMPTRI